MRRTNITQYVYAVNLILIILMFLSVGKAMPKLPDTIPMHFDMEGNPNGWGAKGELWSIAGISAAVSLLMGLLGFFSPKLSKYPSLVNSPGVRRILRLPAEKQQPYWSRLSEFLAVLSCCICLMFFVILNATIRIGLGELKQLSPVYLWGVLGLMFILIIFYMVIMFKTAKRIDQENQ